MRPHRRWWKVWWSAVICVALVPLAMACGRGGGGGSRRAAAGAANTVVYPARGCSSLEEIVKEGEAIKNWDTDDTHGGLARTKTGDVEVTAAAPSDLPDDQDGYAKGHIVARLTAARDVPELSVQGGEVTYVWLENCNQRWRKVYVSHTLEVGQIYKPEVGDAGPHKDRKLGWYPRLRAPYGGLPIGAPLTDAMVANMDERTRALVISSALCNTCGGPWCR